MNLRLLVCLICLLQTVGGQGFRKTRTCDDRNCVECDKNLCRVIWGAGRKGLRGRQGENINAGTNAAGKQKSKGCTPHTKNNKHKSKDKCVCPEGYEQDYQGYAGPARPLRLEQPLFKPVNPPPIMPKECNEFKKVKACSCSRRVIKGPRPFLPPPPRPIYGPLPPVPASQLPTPPPIIFPSPGTNLGLVGGPGNTISTTGSKGGQSSHIHCNNGECVRIVCNNGVCDGVYVPNPDGSQGGNRNIGSNVDGFGVGGFNSRTIGGRTYDGKGFSTGSSTRGSHSGTLNTGHAHLGHTHTNTGTVQGTGFNNAKQSGRTDFVVGRGSWSSSGTRTSISCQYDYQCPQTQVCHAGWCLDDFRQRRHLTIEPCTVTNQCPKNYECQQNTCWDKTTLRRDQFSRTVNLKGGQCLAHSDCGIHRYCRCQNITPCDVGVCVDRYN